MRRDLISGSALMLIGGGYAAYAVLTLPLGTLSQMGPGMFPTGLGVLLALFGLIIFIPALWTSEHIPQVDLKVFVGVMASLAAFAVLIRPTGLIPSVVAATFIASLVMPKRRWLTILILCVVLSLMSWLLFVVALGIRMPLFQWRF